MPLESQNTVRIGLLAGGHKCELLRNTANCVFPQHALSRALRYIIMNPSLIPHDNVIQEVLTFVVIIFQLIAANIHMTALKFFYQLPGHPSFINLVTPMSGRHY